MSKCNNCGASLESSSFIDGNTLKCKCGANIHNEVKYVEKVPFMKSLPRPIDSLKMTKTPY